MIEPRPTFAKSIGVHHAKFCIHTGLSSTTGRHQICIAHAKHHERRTFRQTVSGANMYATHLMKFLKQSDKGRPTGDDYPDIFPKAILNLSLGESACTLSEVHCTVFEEEADCESAKLNPPGGQMHL
jgi:hypothetical protein